MRVLTPNQLISVAAFLITLLIFFSMDAKFRFRGRNRRAGTIFRSTSFVGGVSRSVPIVTTWFTIFLPPGLRPPSMLIYLVPATIAIIAALMLSVEVIFLRKDAGDL